MAGFPGMAICIRIMLSSIIDFFEIKSVYKQETSIIRRKNQGIRKRKA